MKIILLICCLSVSSLLPAQTVWELNKHKNGIKVFTRTESTSKFKSVKVEATLKGSVERFLEILKDVGNNRDWVYSTKQSHLLATNSQNDILYYAESSLPFPVSNRDMVIRMQFDLQSTNTLEVKATGVPDAIDKKKGIVRVPYFNALWNVKSTGNDSLKIDYVLTLDPGGSIPAGISNLFVTKGPYETFSRLSVLLKQ